MTHMIKDITQPGLQGGVMRGFRSEYSLMQLKPYELTKNQKY